MTSSYFDEKISLSDELKNRIRLISSVQTHFSPNKNQSGSAFSRITRSLREEISAAKSKYGSIAGRNPDQARRHGLNPVIEKPQNPNVPPHIHPPLHHQAGRILPQRKRSDGEGCRHVLRAPAVDLPCRDEHEPDLGPLVYEPQSAVIVGEGRAVWVRDGGELGEGEIHGAVLLREARDLEFVHHDARLLWAENEEDRG